MGKGAKSVSKAATYHKYSLITLGAAPLGRALFFKGFQSALNVANSPPLDLSYTMCRVEVIVLLLTTLGATTQGYILLCQPVIATVSLAKNHTCITCKSCIRMSFTNSLISEYIIIEFCVLVKMRRFSPYFHLYVS